MERVYNMTILKKETFTYTSSLYDIWRPYVRFSVTTTDEASLSAVIFAQISLSDISFI